MSDLFEAAGLADDAPRPLADRLRPKTLAEVVGQDHLLGPDGPIGPHDRARAGRLDDPVGPARHRQDHDRAAAVDGVQAAFRATLGGVLRRRRSEEGVRRRARSAARMGQGTLLFVDEIHRFNRSQQDGFLPVVEDGTIVLVGATTENPSFELNGALLSRAQVLVLRRLDDAALETLLERAEAHYGETLPLTDDARASAARDGRRRRALSAQSRRGAGGARRPAKPLDTAAPGRRRCRSARRSTTRPRGALQLISALHKSIRGSDPDAALYWLARMLAGGEEPLYIARRLVRAASRTSAWPIRRPWCRRWRRRTSTIFSAARKAKWRWRRCVIYLATAPKSNAVYTALARPSARPAEHGSLMPPAHILNAPTKLMKDLGYGKGYEYDHEAEEGFSGQNYFPDGMAREQFYQPRETGFEREIAKRLEYWAKLRAKKLEATSM